MSRVTPFLTFNDQAEAAAKLYTSVIPNSRITETTPMTVSFELDGQRFVALDGGPTFKHEEGFSILVSCETQNEIDDYSAALIAGGGSQGPCGWLKDRFGVSWQIVPRVLGELIGDKDPVKAKRAIDAMLKMRKIDIAELRRAHAGQGTATPRT
jgi:predicted 3-demethylubiquinone-9 3-methyltransferase (glyoxalase superfamily)